MKIKSYIIILVLFVLTLFYSDAFTLDNDARIVKEVESLVGSGNISGMNLTGAVASTKAMSMLSLRKWGPMLSLTNAGYAVINGSFTAQAADGITAVTGCTIGASNLGLIHSSKDADLWFAFFSRNTGECVFIKADKNTAGLSVKEIRNMPVEKLFTVIEKRNISLKSIEQNPADFEGDLKKGAFSGRLFPIAGIANVWMHPSFNSEIFNSIMLHNHFCPGLGSGIMLIKYLERELPLREGESYNVIACPNWCKEDAFIAVYDTTPGKRSFYVKGLTDEQKKLLPDNAKNVAGVFIRWNGKKQAGDGMVLAFDFSKIDEGRKVTVDAKFMMAGKLQTAINTLDMLSTPEKCISVIKRINIGNDEELSSLTRAGSDPLKMLEIY